MDFLTAPLLDKPARGWSRDLPMPHETPNVVPDTKLMTNSPNYIDEVYLELARSTVRIRGIAVWFAIVLLFLAATATAMLVHYVVSVKKFEISIFLIMVIGVCIPLFGGAYIWRLDTATPRDEPIRFNRLRKKVYVYRFYHDMFRLFTKNGWFSRAEVYDWNNLRAEVCSIYGPMGSGGLIEGVSLAVVESGTNKVIERFHFAHGSHEGEMYWALAQLYMQHGPEALPEFEYIPRDWNNEDVTLNLARYLAPKVKWPEQIDFESRTAP